jgi:hypothetical protein
MLLAALLMCSLAAEPSAEARDPERGVALLKLAQEARREGRTEQALGDLALAIEADPELAAAYLTRAQLIVDAAGDLEAPPADDAARAEWIEQLQLAASDLERYAVLADAGPEVGEAVQEERARLYAAIVAARTEAEAEPEPEPEPAPKPEPTVAPAVAPEREPDLVDRHRRARLGPGLLGTGVLATGTGVGLLAAGFRIDRACAELCTARWNERAGFLAGGVSAAVVGATLTTIGTVSLTRGRDTVRARRAQRRTGAALVALGGLAAIGTAVLGGLAAAQWRTVAPSDASGLGRTQSLANASLAIGGSIPALLGSGIALLARRG